MLCAGVDVSTRRVAVVLSDPLGVLPIAFVVPLTGSGADSLSCWEAHHHSRDLVSSYADGQELFTLIEQPLVARGNVQTTIKIAKVVGAVTAAFHDCGKVLGVSPAEWKRTLGDARADKQRVKALLRLAWPEGSAAAASDGDLVDAAAICLHARRLAAIGSSLRGGLEEPGSLQAAPHGRGL